MNMIQMVDENTFTLVNRGHNMTLRKLSDGWEMWTENAATRAWRMMIPKFFETLQDVENHYKSWKGVSQLVNV